MTSHFIAKQRRGRRVRRGGGARNTHPRVYLGRAVDPEGRYLRMRHACAHPVMPSCTILKLYTHKNPMF